MAQAIAANVIVGGGVGHGTAAEQVIKAPPAGRPGRSSPALRIGPEPIGGGSEAGLSRAERPQRGLVPCRQPL